MAAAVAAMKKSGAAKLYPEDEAKLSALILESAEDALQEGHLVTMTTTQNIMTVRMMTTTMTMTTSTIAATKNPEEMNDAKCYCYL